MGRKPDQDLRRGWTTGACAAAATKAACLLLRDGAQGGPFRSVQITLPRGETPEFAIAHLDRGDGWVEVGITKDAGDDPDVTHGALVIARVEPGGTGIRFAAGEGVGQVTKPGLPIAIGEPAINPVPREMITKSFVEVMGEGGGALVTVSIPGGEEIAQRTWNPRLGIKGGLSILGTTGIVRPFSCAAWIASIHRGIDVARADGLSHVAGCTGATSEATVQGMLDLPDHAMLDMGDFAGGMLKYLARHPVPKLTIGGGIGKLTKLAQGATDLHSSRSQVDFEDLGQRFGAHIAEANTALDAYSKVGKPMADWVASAAKDKAQSMVPETHVGIVVIDRAGAVLAQA